MTMPLVAAKAQCASASSCSRSECARRSSISAVWRSTLRTNSFTSMRECCEADVRRETLEAREMDERPDLCDL